jgi:serine/threonine-protein kinase
MKLNMSDASALNQATEAPQSRRTGGPSDAPLAGVECCARLPDREGIGSPLEDEFPSDYLLDGRFLIREAIGRSGMATVYRAEDLSDGGRTVAVKVPLLKAESDPVTFGRFLREERIGLILNHPCLLKLIPVAAKKSRPYIVMEYLDGCTLACVLHLTRPLPEKDALRIAAVLCEGVKAMHDRGFVHRDIKPGNIMICRDRTLRLMDFGLSTEISASRSFIAALTPLFGTPEYMAPEQVTNKKNDERTDVYGLGVVLYQMLTGELPFKDADPWKAAQMRVTGDPVAPRTIQPSVSPQAEEIVLSALRRKPEDRYCDTVRFRTALLAPELVEVTGLSRGLRPPRWRISLQGTPFLAGALISVFALLFMVGLFYVIARHAGPGR